MPGVMSALDTGFPSFTGAESTEAKIASIQNYLFMLLEQLRYSMHNLDIARNMNAASVSKFTGAVTEPVYKRLESTEGKLTELSITAEGLRSRVADAEGNISVVAQTASKIEWVVSGSSASTFTLTSRAASLVAQSINLTGFVTFSSLSSPGQTTINGANVTSGVITGATLRSIAPSSQVWVQNGGVFIYDRFGLPAGGIFYHDRGVDSPDQARYRVYIYSDVGHALKIESGANMSIEAPNGTVFALGDWDFRGANIRWD